MSRQRQSLPTPTVGESMLTHFSWQPIKTSDESKRHQLLKPFLDLKNQQRAGKNAHSRFPRCSMKCYGYQRRPKGYIDLCSAMPESRTRHIHIVYTNIRKILWRNARNTLCTCDVEACFFSNSDVSLSVHKSVATGNVCNQTSTW